MNKEKNIESILSETSWWQVNKLFAREYGLDAAVLVVDLDTKQNFFKHKNKLTLDGFFFNDKKEIEFDTSISPYRQDIAIKKLVSLGIIKTEIKKGIPSRRYYKVIKSKINEIVFNLYEKSETSSESQ